MSGYAISRRGPVPVGVSERVGSRVSCRYIRHVCSSACMCFYWVSGCDVGIWCMSVPVPVDQFAPHAPLKEAGAAVAGQDAVVLAAGGVAAHDAQQPRGVLLHGPTVGRQGREGAAGRHGRHRVGGPQRRHLVTQPQGRAGRLAWAGRDSNRDGRASSADGRGHRYCKQR